MYIPQYISIGKTELIHQMAAQYHQDDIDQNENICHKFTNSELQDQG